MAAILGVAAVIYGLVVLFWPDLLIGYERLFPFKQPTYSKRLSGVGLVAFGLYVLSRVL